MMSISPCTAEPVWLSPPRRQEIFAAAPTWMATSTLLQFGNLQNSGGIGAELQGEAAGCFAIGEDPAAVPVFAATFGNDLDGLIFSWNPLSALYVGSRSGFPSARLLASVSKGPGAHRMSLEIFDRMEWVAFDAGRRLRMR